MTPPLYWSPHPSQTLLDGLRDSQACIVSELAKHDCDFWPLLPKDSDLSRFRLFVLLLLLLCCVLCGSLLLALILVPLTTFVSHCMSSLLQTRTSWIARRWMVRSCSTLVNSARIDHQESDRADDVDHRQPFIPFTLSPAIRTSPLCGSLHRSPRNQAAAAGLRDTVPQPNRKSWTNTSCTSGMLELGQSVNK